MIKRAVAAGIVGAITIDLYLWLTVLLPAHGSLLGSWQWIASGAVGPVAMTNPQFAWLGLAVHVVVSIAWAGGFAYLAQTQTFITQRWLISGIFYGFMVYIFMLLIQLGAHVFVFPANADVVVNALIAHCAFFGVPVAYVVARMSRTA